MVTPVPLRMAKYGGCRSSSSLFVCWSGSSSWPLDGTVEATRQILANFGLQRLAVDHGDVDAGTTSTRSRRRVGVHRDTRPSSPGILLNPKHYVGA